MKQIQQYQKYQEQFRSEPALHDPSYAENGLKKVLTIKNAVQDGAWNELPWYESFTDRFIEEAKNSFSFADIGAEWGYYTFLAAKFMPADARIAAFEPDPIRCRLLKEAASEYKNVEVFDYAIHSRQGSITLVKQKGLSATSAEVEGETFSAKAITLDGLYKDDYVDLVKIDIEGAEAEAFKGMTGLIARKNVRIFLELHYWVDDITPGGMQMIESLLLNNGYRFYNLDKEKAEITGALKGVRFYLQPQNIPAGKTMVPPKRNLQIEELILDFAGSDTGRKAYYNIWRPEAQKGLGLKQIENILSAPQLKNLKSVCAAGAEPFLSEKIIDLAKILKSRIPQAYLSGAVSSTRPGKIFEKVNAIREAGVDIRPQVCLNGTPEIHDLVMEREGAWQKAVGLINKLIEKKFPLQVLFSLTPMTIRDLPYVKEFCQLRNIGLEITWIPVVASCRELPPTIYKWPASVKENLRSIEYLPDNFACPGLKKRLVIKPDGAVFPCELEVPALQLGNVNEKPLPEILDSVRTSEICEFIEKGKCQWCQDSGEQGDYLKWMIMDCCRRQSAQAQQYKGKTNFALYAPPRACKEIIDKALENALNVRPESLKPEEITAALYALRARPYERLVYEVEEC